MGVYYETDQTLIDEADMATCGRMFYVMGASGSGKDSVLDGVVEHFSNSQSKRQGLALDIRRVQRSITRPASAGGEDHYAVSEPEFLRQLEQNYFCMHWQAHGLYYGVPRQVEQWLEQGAMVLLNGSREYLPTARTVIPDLVAVLLEVSENVQTERLQNRGREQADAITARVNRQVSFDADDSGLHTIDNNSALEATIDSFCALVQAQSRN